MALEKMDEFFTARAEGYENHMLNNNFGFQNGYKKIAELIPEHVETLLDLGCGTGLELDEIFKKNPNIKVTGVDLTEVMLDKLREKHGEKDLTLIHANYFDYDFGKETYQTIISFETMHHFSHEEKIYLYKKIFNALKEKGQYIECDYMVTEQREEDFYYAENARIRKEQGVLEGELYHYDTPCTIENQIMLFAAAGFSDVKKLWREENTTIMIGYKRSEKLEEIIKQWGIHGEIEKINERVWQIGTEYVIKKYESMDELQRNIILIRELLEEDISVSPIITALDGNDYLEYYNSYFLVTKKLRGNSTIDIYQEDGKVAFQIGEVLAKLHKALKKCEDKFKVWDNCLLKEMKGWVTEAVNGDFQDSIAELENLYSGFPFQLIHRDVHLGNFLFFNGEFSGYIDFDLSQRNIRIFDICYFLLGILVGHENNPDDVEKWFSIVKDVLKGYELINSLSKEEKEGIPCVMKNIEILFIAYFTNEKQNVLAEGAENLYHFIKEQEEKLEKIIMYV